MKKLQYRIEAALLSLLFLGFRLLPLDIASEIGAWMARGIGPFFSAHRTAKKNIAAAFPELTPREINRLAGDMWDHLGRVGAEYPSLPGDRLSSRASVIGIEHLPKPGTACFFFSGHIGNWELVCPAVDQLGVKLSVVYRHTNNPYVDKIIGRLRASHCHELIAKGLRGGMKILGALKRGGTVAMLVDQKQNNGIAVPFFGRDAMTSPAIAQIALKYDVPLIPVHVVRTKGAHFNITIHPPLAYEKTGDHDKDVLAVMTRINALLESWIRENPAQWFWVHRRWPRQA